MKPPPFDVGLLDDLRVQTLGHLMVVGDALDRIDVGGAPGPSSEWKAHYAEGQMLFAMKHLQYALLKVQEFRRAYVTMDSFLRELAAEPTIFTDGAPDLNGDGKGGEA